MKQELITALIYLLAVLLCICAIMFIVWYEEKRKYEHERIKRDFRNKLPKEERELLLYYDNLWTYVKVFNKHRRKEKKEVKKECQH